MMTGTFAWLRPEQLTISLAFPQRESPSPLGPLKNSIREFGAVLRPIVVRQIEGDAYQVLDGRRQLKAIWELRGEGSTHFDTVPCFVLPSEGPVMDLRLFLLLNQQAPFGAGDHERVQAAIEDALQKSPPAP